MLTTYPQIRDRIYELARIHGLRVDWAETSRSVRLVLLYEQTQIVVARGIVPVRDIRATQVNKLEHDLQHVFGKDWLQ
ncbi:hypothetical protein Aph01nite_72780 [Acrocarpospora phusangensis]|uniref:Uncharacterized protein n=1 Tax=Acrocarpospora phusangensis TaxID=1070424 RepID=A0A919USS4_9ACTN|nr:hypothetical protein [Acrocarpospora phusangensis]GIH28968.1 hypothetical protein Aph01nite_72780 [Acrocarpospora phusangensis]